MVCCFLLAPKLFFAIELSEASPPQSELLNSWKTDRDSFLPSAQILLPKGCYSSLIMLKLPMLNYVPTNNTVILIT